MAHSSVIAIGPDPSNSAKAIVELSAPYIARVGIVGVADLLMHRWNVEAVEAKGRAAKGSKAKKTDDLESYVYRTEGGELAAPGEYLRGSIINAAKYRQDPRSPRKSAMDLFKAGVVALTPLASFGVSAWDYEHKCRVTVQRNGVTRVRPAMRAGWTLEVDILVNLPEYIPPDVLHEVVGNAGRLIGLADFRPTYGRYAVKAFDVLLAA
jgi:hypothetical protein